MCSACMPVQVIDGFVSGEGPQESALKCAVFSSPDNITAVYRHAASAAAGLVSQLAGLAHACRIWVGLESCCGLLLLHKCGHMAHLVSETLHA